MHLNQGVAGSPKHMADLSKVKNIGIAATGLGIVALVGAAVLATPFLEGTALGLAFPFIATVGAFCAPVASVALVIGLIAGALLCLVVGIFLSGRAQYLIDQYMHDRVEEPVEENLSLQEEEIISS